MSEASSDAASVSAVKVLTHATQKSEDSSGNGSEMKNDEKFTSVSVKVERKEHGDVNCTLATEDGTASASCAKVKSENSVCGAETARVKVKDEQSDGEKSAEFAATQQPASEAVVNGDTGRSNAVGPAVETTPQLDDRVSVCANVSGVCQPGLLQPGDELEKVCSKTNADSLVENDSCRDDAESASVNVGNVVSVQRSSDNDSNTASSNVSETGCQPVSCDNISKSAESQCEDQDQSTESKTDAATATQAKCSSPQKSKKHATNKQGTTPPESPGLWGISYICS